MYNNDVIYNNKRIMYKGINVMLNVKEIENTSAISITTEFLTDLTNQLGKNFENISYVATLKNGDTKVFDSLDSICGYENALEKRIVKLEIIAYNAQNESSYLFLMKKDKTSIHGIVSTKDKITTNTICKDLDYIIRRHSEGAVYSYIAAQNFWEFTEKVFFILLCISLFTFDNTSNSENISVILILTKYLIPLLELSLMFLVLMKGIHKILQYFFPIIIFEIGDEIKCNSKRMGLKKNIIWAIFVAIFASVVGSFIYAGLTRSETPSKIPTEQSNTLP